MCYHQCPRDPRRPWEMCPGCAAERLLYDLEEAEFDRTARLDPALAPGHKPATDDEWWGAVMGGLIEAPEGTTRGTATI